MFLLKKERILQQKRPRFVEWGRKRVKMLGIERRSATEAPTLSHIRILRIK
jgi:hypothetical protein